MCATKGSNPKISILGSSAYSSLGGIQSANKNLIRALNELNYLNDAHFRFDAPEDIPKHLLIRGYKGSLCKMLLRLIQQKISRQRSNLLVCDHINYSPLAQVAAFPSGKYCVFAHAYELAIPVSGLRMQAFKSAKAVICVSDFTKKLCLKLGIHENKLITCHHGLDLPLVPLRTNFPHKKVILFVGRIDEHYKGQKHLIEAMRNIIKELPDAHLVFAGTGDSTQYRQLVTSYHLQNYVSFLGKVSNKELYELYKNAYLFAMPSQYEGFGLVYLEAMARGIPCLISKNDAAQEIIEDNISGLAVQYGDVPQITNALLLLLKNPELRNKMGEEAQIRYKKNFTFEAYKGRIKSTFQHILTL